MTVVLNAELAERWRDGDVFERLDAMPGEDFRRVRGRRTFRFEECGRAYFAKVHTGVGWREILKNLMQLRLPVIDASNEWRAALLCRYRGIATAVPLAYGARGRDPARRRAFIVTREVDDARSLEDCVSDWQAGRASVLPSGEAVPPPDPCQRRRLLEAVARLVRRLHEAGINHRDLYVCHLWLRGGWPTDGGLPELLLLDLHRAQIRPRVPERWRRKDLAALLYSALELPSGLRPTVREQLRFRRIYAAASPLAGANAAPFWQSVQQRAARLQRRHQDRDPDTAR